METKSIFSIPNTVQTNIKMLFIMTLYVFYFQEWCKFSLIENKNKKIIIFWGQFEKTKDTEIYLYIDKKWLDWSNLWKIVSK